MHRALGSRTYLLHIVSFFQSAQNRPQGLKKHSLDQATRQSFFIVLIELAKRRRRLPDSIMITEKTMAADQVHTSGNSCEVRLGTLNNTAIAVKTPRFTTTINIEKIREVSWEIASFLSALLKCPLQRFCREVILWNSLSHPNILKLKGALGSIDTFNFSTASKWMTRGTIARYIEANYDVNRLELVCTVPDSSPRLMFNSVNL